MKGLRDRYHLDTVNSIHMGDDLMLAIARGRIPSVGQVTKFGRNPLIASGADAEVWDGLIAYSFPATSLPSSVRVPGLE